MDGILLIDKPAGWTSHDVVAKVRSSLRNQVNSEKFIVDSESLKTKNSKLKTPSPKVKVGHTGTLDPAATGLMILVIGNYTKRAAEFSKLDKTYEAEITLGAISSTGDSEGEITKVRSMKKGVEREEPSKEALEAVLRQFEGEIEQTPPIYSAIKIDGQRAYKMARKGVTPVMESRKVTVYRLEVTEYKYPKIKIITEVSSGTFIRSLAEDIGKELGTGAYLSALRRTTVGPYSIKAALPLTAVSANAITS